MKIDPRVHGKDKKNTEAKYIIDKCKKNPTENTLFCRKLVTKKVSHFILKDFPWPVKSRSLCL